MRNAKEYKRRCELAKEENYVFYETFNRWCGVSERDRLNITLKANKEAAKKQDNVHLLDKTGRAYYYTTYINNYKVYRLFSYNTLVCEVVTELYVPYCYQTFTKKWFGYSATTLKHINLFRAMFGLDKLSKYDWIMMD